LLKRELKYFYLKNESEMFILFRVTHDISLMDGPVDLSTSVVLSLRAPISGLLGLIQLPSGPALIVAQQSEKVKFFL